MGQHFSNDSFFKYVPAAPRDPIFGLQATYNGDVRPHKINLTVGYLASQDGSLPVVLDSVKDAARELAETEITKNYLPISGDKAYVDAVRSFIFGESEDHQIIGLGCAGGTAAIRMLAELIFDHITQNVCLSSPTWPNHTQIFQRVGYDVSYYPYEVGTKVDFAKIKDHLSQLPKSTLVLFQPMSHNPTGCDLTTEEWSELSKLCKEKHLMPFFDTAYQGLGVGIREDVEPIMIFLRDGHEMVVSHSFSKSMGLYGERVGAAFLVLNPESPMSNVQDQLKLVTRTTYSNPPRHGEALAHLILSNPKRREAWEGQVHEMRNRVDGYRKKLAEGFAQVSGRDCTYIQQGHGFFCKLNLSKEQSIRMREEFAVYITDSSRVNIAALNDQNIDLVIDAIKGVV